MFEHTYMAESIHEGIVHFLPNKYLVQIPKVLVTEVKLEEDMLHQKTTQIWAAVEITRKDMQTVQLVSRNQSI